jgi:hypothetical protein
MYLEKLNVAGVPATPAMPSRAGALAGFSSRRAPVRPERVIQQVGNPTEAHVEFANTLLGAMPDEVLRAARDSYSARALVFCLLLGDDELVRQRQINGLRENVDSRVYDEVLRLAPVVREMGSAARLPLTDLTIGALRALSPSQANAFFASAKALIEADQRVTVTEYALYKVLTRALLPSRQPTVKYVALGPMMEHAAVVLSALAEAGTRSEAQRMQAFRNGLVAMEQDASKVTMTPSPSVQSIDLALNQLVMASPGVKRRIIAGCAAAVASDNVVQVEEGELLRAVAATLDCPIPPLVGN